VVEVAAKRLRLAYHIKKAPKEIEKPEWEWKFLLDKLLAAPK
jgi:hypothetical protein